MTKSEMLAKAEEIRNTVSFIYEFKGFRKVSDVELSALEIESFVKEKIYNNTVTSNVVISKNSKTGESKIFRFEVIESENAYDDQIKLIA